MESFSYGIAHLISAVEGIDKQMKVWNRNLTEARENLKIQNQIVSEPFAEAEKLKQKRSRYNEVMDILNPPKEEQSLDTDGGDAVQYQQRKNADIDPYPTSDVHWAIEAGIITNADARAVWKAIADNQKRKIVYPQTVRGEIFVANRNVLMVVNPNYRYPSINTIYKFDDQYEQSAIVAGEEIINAKGIQSEERKAIDLIEIVYGEGYVTRYTIEDYGADAWEDGLGKGKNSGAVDSESSEQYQQRTYALTDWEVLEHAYDALDKTDMEPGERTALDIFKGRLDTLRDLQSK